MVKWICSVLQKDPQKFRLVNVAGKASEEGQQQQERQAPILFNVKANTASIGATQARQNQLNQPLYQHRHELEQSLQLWWNDKAADPEFVSVFVLWGIGGPGKSTLAHAFTAKVVEFDAMGTLRLVFMLSGGNLDQDYGSYQRRFR